MDYITRIPYPTIIPSDNQVFIDGLPSYKPSLVGGLEHFLFFPFSWEESSQLTFIFFREVETTNQFMYVSFLLATLPEDIPIKSPSLFTSPLGLVIIPIHPLAISPLVIYPLYSYIYHKP